MTDTPVVSSEVEVQVDPQTAFTAFTEEMDLWWQRGPINFFGDSARIVEVRCEPGVGGRIVEVYDRPDSAEGFVRARITEWEPAARIAWDSEADDVQTVVRFERTDTGTRVVVEHYIPVDGVDRGGTAWSRTVPKWFGRWCARRDRVPHELRDISRVALALYYERPAAAARWLADVFGFESLDELPMGEDPLPHTEYGHPWIEFSVGSARLMVFPVEPDRAAGSATIPWVYVDDLEAHFAQAKGRGAAIVEEIHEYPGSRVYVADDLEGNRWTFLQARPTQ